MLIDEIINESRERKVMVFFDMDGTICEYKSGEGKALLDNVAGIYLNKRPLKAVLEKVKYLASISNVTVGILSNCYYKEQKEEKLKWLEKHAPFINKKDIHVIVLNEQEYTKENKDYLKVNYLNMLIKDELLIYLIEDNHNIISATRKVNNRIRAEHVSTIID